LNCNLSRFVPNSVEILTWNFIKKLFRENFSIILCISRIYQTLWNFALVSGILFWVRIVLKKFTQVLLYVVFTQARRHVHKQITKTRYGDEKPGRIVLRNLVLFTLGMGLTTPNSLGLLVWNIYQTFDNMCVKFWLRFENQIRPTKFAINVLFITARAVRNVYLCVKLVDSFPRWILIRLTWN